MSTERPVLLLPAIDKPPADGVYRDAEVRAFGKLTDEEIAAGNMLGKTIDRDDDGDAGA